MMIYPFIGKDFCFAVKSPNYGKDINKMIFLTKLLWFQDVNFFKLKKKKKKIFIVLQVQSSDICTI